MITLKFLSSLMSYSSLRGRECTPTSRNGSSVMPSPGVEGVYDKDPFRDREGRGIGAPRGTEAPRLHARNFNPWTLPARGHSLVALPHLRDLLLSAKHLFVHGHWWRAPLPGIRMSNGTTLKSEDLASIPMAQGGLTRLAVARLKSAGVPVAPLLMRAGLTPELIAEPEERLTVRGQIAFLSEAASALKDDCLGFTLARDHDPREIGLLYYVMASSRTLGEALQRLARYSTVTNEALVFGYREGNRLVIDLSYSGVPRHSDRHQMEFCMFAALRICRM